VAELVEHLFHGAGEEKVRATGEAVELLVEAVQGKDRGAAGEVGFSEDERQDGVEEVHGGDAQDTVGGETG